MGYINSTKRQPKIGEIYVMTFTGTDSEQRGVRPGIVFQNNMGNLYSPNIIALPLTSSLKKVNQPTHVLIPSEIGLARDSMVLCENPECISKSKIGEFITLLPEEYMRKIAVASILASSAISFLTPEILISVREKAIALNYKI